MSGLMNSYFYGKAGQGDYTVEQMPTTRKQLFFTTLRVRFSAMMGLNLLHVLFTLPIIIWLAISWTMISAILSDEAYNLGGDVMRSAYDEYMVYRTEFEAILNSDNRVAELEVTLKGVEFDIQSLSEGKEVFIEEPGIAGAEPTKRPATMEELVIKRNDIRAQLNQNLRFTEYKHAYTESVKDIDLVSYLGALDASVKALYTPPVPAGGEGYNALEHARGLYAALGERAEFKDVKDELYMHILLRDALSTESVYENMRTNLLTSQISMALIIMVPLIAIAGIGSTGQMYVLRNWARDEHSFMWTDYKAAIKSNWKQGLGVGFFNGLSLILCYVGFMTYRSMAADGSVFFVIPQMLMIMILIVWWMMNEIVFPMMVTYDMKFGHLLRNSAIMALARLPISFAILVGSLIVPVVLLLFVPMSYSILILIVLYGLIGYSLTGFVFASFANSCFDKFLNPRIEGAEVNKGLRDPEEDDDDEESAEQIDGSEPKEDRFWEHKK